MKYYLLSFYILIVNILGNYFLHIIKLIWNIETWKNLQLLSIPDILMKCFTIPGAFRA